VKGFISLNFLPLVWLCQKRKLQNIYNLSSVAKIMTFDLYKTSRLCHLQQT